MKPHGYGGKILRVNLTSGKLVEEPTEKYAKEFNKNLKMEPERAAQIILNGILGKKEKVIIGNDARKAIFAYRYLPFIFKKIARQTMQKFKN